MCILKHLKNSIMVLFRVKAVPMELVVQLVHLVPGYVHYMTHARPDT